MCIRCKITAAASLCCSSHNALLCHRCYRRTHFVDICVAGCSDCAREGLDPMSRPGPAPVQDALVTAPYSSGVDRE